MDWYDAAIEYAKRTYEHDCCLSSLSADWQRELVALMWVNMDVSNGGYLQFLVNNGREAYVYAHRALKTIGADKMADLIERCQAIVDEFFPCEGKSADELEQLLPNQIIGRDGRTVKEAGSVLPEFVLERISELSYEFSEYSDDVSELAERRFRRLIDSDPPT